MGVRPQRRSGAQAPGPATPDPGHLAQRRRPAYYEDVRSGRGALPAGFERNGATIVYIGLYSYYPNRMAATELIDKIAPAVLARMPQRAFHFRRQ